MWSNRGGMLLCIVGPAGSGKSTIVRMILEEFPQTVKKSISVTTRPPRIGEVDGVNYHFISSKMFEDWINEGRFFEWEETHGNRYGTLKGAIEEAVNSGIDLIFDIDIRGALTLKKSFPKETVHVFLLAPSSDEMVQRIKGRSEVSEDELKKRLATASRELAQVEPNISQIDYILVNKDLNEAYQVVSSIVRAERVRPSRVSSDELKAFLKG